MSESIFSDPTQIKKLVDLLKHNVVVQKGIDENDNSIE